MFEKESGDYLAQISNNAEEKTAFLSTALEDNSLPKVGDKVRLMELGTGGGESLQALQQATEKLEGRDDIEVIAAEIMPKLAASLKRQTGIEIIASDASHIPLKNESVSAINASAVLHEVYSYGTRTTEETKSGRDAVMQSLGEVNRVLVENGMLAYRDVLAFEGDPMAVKKVQYGHPAWEKFYDFFTEYFLKAKVSPYAKESVKKMSAEEEPLTLEAPRGFQREFQRHYLMFRDYMRNAIGRSVGVNIMNTGWMDKERGLKFFTFYVDPDTKPLLDNYVFESHESADGVLYKMNSDDFDRFYDDVILRTLEKTKGDDAQSKELADKVHRWQEREGQEYYTYASPSQFIGLVAKASLDQNPSSVMLPESLDHVRIVPRFYYNRYLKSVIDIPETDGKQIIAFRKMNVIQAKKHIVELIERNQVEGVVAWGELEKIDRLIPKA